MDFSQAASHLNWLAILVAPLAGFVIGSIWYGPLFGKAWMRASGVTKEHAGSRDIAKTFGGVFVLNLIASASLAMFIGPTGTWQYGLIAGLLTGLTFISVALGVTYLFESRPFSLFAINAGYQTVLFAAMGAILGAWR
jgi:hypothetical protein